MKNKIYPLGELIKTNSKGFLENKLNKKKIVSPWKECVEIVKQAYLENLSEEIESIYIRGSVARGSAIKGISDIDSFAVVKSNPKDLNLLWVEEQKRVIKRRFPFISKVEFGFFGKDSLMKDKKHFPARFNIKLLSVCVYGDDLAREIKNVRPDLKTARELQENLEKVVRTTKSELLENNKKKIKERCSWAMKRILRQGMVLTMSREKAFSRDLYKCYEIFSKYYPEKETEMRGVLELAIFPSPNKEKLFKILDNFCPWLSLESKKLLN